MEHNAFYQDKELAAKLGINPVTLRRWRMKNKKAGRLIYGPPYEYRCHRVVYPREQFEQWCRQVNIVGGVAHINMPVTATIPTPQVGYAKEV